MFSISVDCLPVVRNYEAAKRFHDSIPPIRGRSPEIRPFGKRRDHTKTITDRGDYVACCLYGLEVVKFFKDGRMELDTHGYSTVSTAAFIDRVAGPVRSSRKAHGGICVQLGGLTPAEEYGKYLLTGNHSVVTMHPNGTVDAEPCVIHKLKQEEYKAKCKEYKAFMDYLVGVIKVSGGRIDYTTDQIKTVCHADTGFFAVPHTDDMDVWLAWAAHIVSTVRQRQRWWSTTVVVDAAKAKVVARDLIKIHNQSLFERVTLPLGQVKSDPNRKFIRSHA